MVIPIIVAQMVAIVGETDIGTGHLASRSLLVLAMPTASVDSFHAPLPSCRSATVTSLTPAIPWGCSITDSQLPLTTSCHRQPVATDN